MNSVTALSITRFAHAHDTPLPSYQTIDSAGMDLLAAVENEILIAPN